MERQKGRALPWKRYRRCTATFLGRRAPRAAGFGGASPLLLRRQDTDELSTAAASSAPSATSGRGRWTDDGAAGTTSPELKPDERTSFTTRAAKVDREQGQAAQVETEKDRTAKSKKPEESASESDASDVVQASIEKSATEEEVMASKNEVAGEDEKLQSAGSGDCARPACLEVPGGSDGSDIKRAATDVTSSALQNVSQLQDETVEAAKQHGDGATERNVFNNECKNHGSCTAAVDDVEVETDDGTRNRFTMWREPSSYEVFLRLADVVRQDLSSEQDLQEALQTSLLSTDTLYAMSVYAKAIIAEELEIEPEHLYCFPLADALGRGGREEETKASVQARLPEICGKIDRIHKVFDYVNRMRQVAQSSREKKASVTLKLAPIPVTEMYPDLIRTKVSAVCSSVEWVHCEPMSVGAGAYVWLQFRERWHLEAVQRAVKENGLFGFGVSAKEVPTFSLRERREKERQWAERAQNQWGSRKGKGKSGKGKQGKRSAAGGKNHKGSAGTSKGGS
ncbi:unnamed protein product [Amoebophrya sp. A120]|nr:unnamed protein product [Amoebophrya sp. A120]|eukprot:GSA120T00021635001.1